MSTDPASAPPVAAGYEALERGAWEEARIRFEEALADGETPEGLEGLGMAAWWLQDVAATFDARERAYRLYRERGDSRGAARMAICLADDHAWWRREPAVASGWLQWARRLLDGVEPGPEHGRRLLCEGELALAFHADPLTARKLAREAVALGRSLGLMDIEMWGLALEGLAFVTQGEIPEGMRRLDQASTAAMAGEMQDPCAIGSICCYSISACERVRDYDRAAQWCQRMAEFCRRSRSAWFLSLCRAHHASVLMWRGDWASAEAELEAAIGDLRATRPAVSVDVVVRLAELRRRQGRLEEAETLFAQSEVHPLSLLGRAALALDRGEPAAAAGLLDRFMRRIPPEDRTERVVALELLVAAQTALGDRTRAAAAAAELEAIAAAIGTLPLRALASFARGIAAAGVLDHEAARRSFEDAVDLFQQSGARFEAARARIALARSLSALGHRAAAGQEATAALAAFRAMGAAAEAGHAEAFLRGEALPGGRPGTEPRPAGLTRRELEVLRLMAQGLTNPEIAGRLVLSEHTIHRHVANILTKLGVPSRAAAVARAARDGFI